jgi:hypothetical protein
MALDCLLVFLLVCTFCSLCYWNYTTYLKNRPDTPIDTKGCWIVNSEKVGLGTTLLTYIHGLLKFENLVINMTDSPYFSDHFFKNNNTLTHSHKMCQNLPYQSLRSVINKKQKTLSSECSELCPSLKKLWSAINTTTENSLPKFGSRLLLHVRGGDKLYKEVPRKYTFRFLYRMRLAQKMWQRNRFESCLIIGDDYSMTDALKKAAIKTFGCRVDILISAGQHIQEQFNNLADESRSKKTAVVFRDIDLLATEPYVIAMSLSNIVRLAAMLQHCRTGQAATILDWNGLNIDKDKCLL